MKEELISCFNKQIYVDVDEWRGNRVKELKGTQPEKIKELQHIVESQQIDMFLDIGANYGEFAICLADYNIPIVCFEPNPICAKLLNKTFKNIPNVVIVEAAAGIADGIKSFYYSKNYSGGGSFAKNVIQRAHHSKGEVEEIQTQVYRIDNYITNNYPNLPKNILLKIDVEGFEDEVFEGCKNILDKCNWKALIETNMSAVQNANKDYIQWYKNFIPYTVYKNFNNGDILIGNY
jgi:FkbM family methyltransferase